MNINDIKQYIEITIMLIIGIASLILLIKILLKKVDKNKNGKIEKEEINNADLQFLKEMLKESFITIATGLSNMGGITGKKSYNLILTELKNNKAIFEEQENQQKEGEKIEKNNK